MANDDTVNVSSHWVRRRYPTFEEEAVAAQLSRCRLFWVAVIMICIPFGRSMSLVLGVVSQLSN